MTGAVNCSFGWIMAHRTAPPAVLCWLTLYKTPLIAHPLVHPGDLFCSSVPNVGLGDSTEAVKARPRTIQCYRAQMSGELDQYRLLKYF